MGRLNRHVREVACLSLTTPASAVLGFRLCRRGYGQVGAHWGQCTKDMSCGLYYSELVERLILRITRMFVHKLCLHANADTSIQNGMLRF